MFDDTGGQNPTTPRSEEMPVSEGDRNESLFDRVLSGLDGASVAVMAVLNGKTTENHGKTIGKP